MEHEPIRQYTSNGVIQKMLKEWTVANITPRRSFYLLRLWLGFDSTNRMDEKGRWSKEEFTLLKTHYCYRTVLDFIGDIRRTRSFILVGNDINMPDFIASPNWYQWQEEDGPLQPYSLGYKADFRNAKIAGKIAGFKEIIFKENSLPESNPDGSEAGAMTDEEIHEHEEMRRLKALEVKDYFTWLMEQEDDAHKKIVNGILEAIRYPRLPKAKKDLIPSGYYRTEAEAAKFLPFLIANQLVPYFAGRDKFFEVRYRQYPAARCYWMSNFVTHYINRFVVIANQNWDRLQEKERKRTAAKQQKEARNNHPRSPYEWEDAEGNRFYADDSDLAIIIPPEAPTREEDNTHYSTLLNQWLKI